MNTKSPTIRLLLIALLMTCLGAALIVAYFAAPTYQSVMNYGTVQVGWANDTDSLKVNSFSIGASPSQNLLILSFSAYSFKQGTDVFYVVLPVHVSALSTDKNDWKCYNTPDHGSLLVARVLSNRTSYIWAEITTNDSLVSGNRGEYVFFLPAGQTIPYSVSQYWGQLKIPVSTYGPGGYHATESVSIPGGSTWSLIYPPTAVPTQGNFTLGSYENLAWDFDRAQPVFLRYTVESEVALYNLDFALGGIFLGAGISLVPSAYSDHLRSRMDK